MTNAKTVLALDKVYLLTDGLIRAITRNGLHLVKLPVHPRGAEYWAAFATFDEGYPVADSGVQEVTPALATAGIFPAGKAGTLAEGLIRLPVGTSRSQAADMAAQVTLRAVEEYYSRGLNVAR